MSSQLSDHCKCMYKLKEKYLNFTLKLPELFTDRICEPFEYWTTSQTLESS